MIRRAVAILLVAAGATSAVAIDLEERLASARALAEGGRFAEAERAFQAILEDDVANARAHNDLGIIYWETGRPSEAVLHFKLAAHHDPTMAKAHKNLGLVALDQGRYREALRAYRRAVVLAPSDAEAYIGFGFAALYLREFDEARRAVDKVVSLGDARAVILENELHRARGELLPPTQP